jgi:acetyl-CoA carboxylase biotin carboxylase subunit
VKILIANRGEIAVRVLRACRELGFSAATVFSEADRFSPHVLLSEEAHFIGPSPAAQSYLRGDALVELAKRIGAGAVHPGYGFLAENASFARTCREAGLVFVGPSPESMELLGSKTMSRREAAKHGIPITPGTTEPVGTAEEARPIVEEIGPPVLLKASAGGGGKGMRRLDDLKDLPALFERAASEAAAYFADPRIYIEKLIENPRHIEVQILADRHGNRIALGERECSMQRRHQKIIEESPSPIVDEPTRRRLEELALKVVDMACYDSAGTVEFLRGPDGAYYFLEVNTRIQVEHPVTEMVTGVDLVKEQILTALGERLSLKAGDVSLRGHAIECRIYAEDPLRNFAPSPGRVLNIQRPDGPGVRVDSGICEGFVVPLDYDPLLGKLIVWGRDRREAIERSLRALDEYRVDGIATTIPFFQQILLLEDFRKGNLDTGLVDRFLRTFEVRQAEGQLPFALALAAKLFLEEHQTRVLPPQPRTAWRRG